MLDEKSLVTAKKRQSPQVQMRVVFVTLIERLSLTFTANGKRQK